MNLPILMYHGITERTGDVPGSFSTPISNFKDQMGYMSRKGYNSISLSELAAAGNKRVKLLPKPFVITFDDAPASILPSAAETLKYYGFKAVIFVVASAIGRYNFWDDGKPVPRMECMDLDELKGLKKAGWEIGSHTETHAELQTLQPDKMKSEIEGSKAALEKLFGTKIGSFCYPYGGCNDAVRNEIIAAGYTSACAISAATGSVTEDIYRLKRIYIKPEDSLFTFKRKVAPWYLLLRGLKKR